MSEDYTNSDILIIGAGIVGLATAYQIIRRWPDLKIEILEKESEIAAHQTGRNSGVIHSGVYYPPTSIKAQTCLAGYKELLNFCDENSVRHEVCGKLIVATSLQEVPSLKKLHERGTANNLQGLELLDTAGVSEIEPYCNATAGLLVPQTGIINYKEVCEKLASVLSGLGVNINLNQSVTKLSRFRNLSIAKTGNGSWKSKLIIGCAGLNSDRIAIDVFPNLPVRIIPFKGEYYYLNPEGRHFVNNLIYPVPDPKLPFLGVHFTRTVDGGIECGPNAIFALGREAYKKMQINMDDVFDSFCWPGFWRLAAKHWRHGFSEHYRSLSKQAFVRALQKLIPYIEAHHLEAGGAGIRAQACDRAGHLVDDFFIKDSKGFIFLLNAPSPAATAAFSIGRVMTEKVKTHLLLSR